MHTHPRVRSGPIKLSRVQRNLYYLRLRHHLQTVAQASACARLLPQGPLAVLPRFSKPACLNASQTLRTQLFQLYSASPHMERESRMGTIRNWLQVVFLGAAWGGFMLYWSTRMRTVGGMKWPPSFAQIVSLSLLSLWFGIVVTFSWIRAFHPPLVFITAPSLIGALIFRLFASSNTRNP
jgi:hypothetical protein